jgi:hypothetical protein
MDSAVQRIEAMPMPNMAACPQAQGCSEVSEDEVPPQLVPALPEQHPLQPAKLAVWRLFMEQVSMPDPSHIPWSCPCHCSREEGSS